MAVEIRAVSEQMEAALKRVPALRRKVVESVTQKVKARLDTEIASRVRRLDANAQVLVLTDGTRIPFDALLSIC